MIHKKDPDVESGGAIEKFDNYVPPTPPQPKVKKAAGTPSRKRTAPISFGSPAASVSSPAKKPGSAKKKKETAGNSKLGEEPTMSIGIDFGTTHTGVAYAWSGNPQKIEVITNWDDTTNDQVKVPSAIKFLAEAPGVMKWGAKAKTAAGALKWFKLLLIDEVDLAEDIRTSAYLQEARNQLRDLVMTAVEVIALFLEKIWNHCISKIKVAEGNDTVDTSRFHVVITLPAIWPHYSRDRMREAVVRAGILNGRSGVGKTTLSFVAEPEAAALATLSGVDGRHDIKIRDNFVIVDCGGGTVDVISYKVTKTDSMIVREAATGEGALCGAIMVDDRFRSLLVTKLEEVSEHAMQRLRERDIQDLMITEWENGIRSQFTGEESEWIIRQPQRLVNPSIFVDEDDDDDNAGYPTFTITHEEVKEVFRPIVERIYELVEAQIRDVQMKTERLPKYIILVGGFGRCQYLQKYLSSRFEGVEILQKWGSEPWSAICRGAVIHGLTNENFDSLLAVQDKIWDEDQQADMAGNQFKPLITRGEDIPVGKTFRKEFFKIQTDYSSDISTSVFLSKSERPPTRKDGSVSKLCDIRWIKDIDEDELQGFVNKNGGEFLRMGFITEMKLSGGAVEFRIFHDGKLQARENVAVEFQDHGNV
ncbi:ctin-like atpase domain-containing protein [Diaporthe amygdali]|uniref:ctin-like atpase domain-containing protein n=1 Tax=Phomopsis amygdali TaxID=1214568 RepID=UPI0022FDF679|nr:ctin-like atpase domain-containing protein [Diaporthe amygdali]KAJ0113811.1 ctin-like atpase domain-containing protein [Diaporthe amygdali]